MISQRKLVKVLYIDENLDERASAAHLESITKHLSLTCIFTVMQNALTALESMESVTYDLCFIADDLSDTCSMGAFEFLRVVKIVGSLMPIVLLTKHDSNIPDQKGLPYIGFHPSNYRLAQFSASLARPYTRSEICMIITHAFTAPSPKYSSMEGSMCQSFHRSKAQISPIPFSPVNTNSTSSAGTLHENNSNSRGLSLSNIWAMQEMTLQEQGLMMPFPNHIHDQNLEIAVSPMVESDHVGKRLYEDLVIRDSPFHYGDQLSSSGVVSTYKKPKVGSY